MKKQVTDHPYWQAALDAIDREDDVVFDVAADHAQMVANVKHMTWFIQEVADVLMADAETE